jgi:hypothetical protein
MPNYFEVLKRHPRKMDKHIQPKFVEKRRKEMKRLGLVFVLLLVFIAGCSNWQRSSKEEAIFTIEHLPDFQERIQYLSFESEGFLFPASRPFVYQMEPELKIDGKFIIHEVIYKTTTNSFEVVLLDDRRPPKVVVSKEFK